jgi:hypothetical protein
MNNDKALQNKRQTKENPVIVNSVARSKQAFTATLGKKRRARGLTAIKLFYIAVIPCCCLLSL